MAIDTLQVDRVLATVLFTDIVGSTKLASELGDRRWREVLDQHHSMVRADVERFGGRVIKTIGDGFLVTFDSPARAILCARAITEASDGIGVQVRAGIHTGECEVIGDDVGGIAVHIASRVSSLAAGDEILVSSTVKELVQGSHLEFAAKGAARTLKGVDGKWRLFSVQWEREHEPAPVGELRRSGYPLVGRLAEIAAVREELDLAAAGSLRVVTVEGEPGIGKTRLMDESADGATQRSMQTVFVGADEELQGPYYLARSLLGSPALVAAADPAGRKALASAADGLAGKIDKTLRSFPAEDLQLHLFDRAAAALCAVAQAKPLAVFLDDLQWADEDSVRLIRYLVRTDPSIRLFLMLAFRSDAGPSLRALSVDASRLGVGRRIELLRLNASEARELLEHVLGGPASPSCAEALFGQSEGVPFILEELVRSLREAGTVQDIDGVWEISTLGLRAVPSSIQSLVERKAAALSPETRELLADAAALGRRFSLKDLTAVTRAMKGASAPGPAELASLLDSAAGVGLIAELPEGSRHDYAFTHDQARAVLAAAHGRPRRRLVHGAILELLDPDGSPPPELLIALVGHARNAGDAERTTRYAIAAARQALEASAGEQALSALGPALEVAEKPDDRLELLRLRDDALELLLRGGERAAGLDEFGKLAAQIGGQDLEFELMRRRSAAARTSGDFALAADLAGMAQEAARERGDTKAELEAALQLGQALMRAPLLEAYNPPPSEVDLDAVWAAYSRALELAEAAGDERTVALTKRELGVVQNGRAKNFAVQNFGPLVQLEGRYHLPLEASPMWEGVDAEYAGAKDLLGEALDIFERLDDRAGVLSTVIALSYSHYHSGVRRGVAGVIEQIRKLRLRLRSVVGESERQVDEANMLYAVHGYARYYHYVDLALERGEDAYRAAQSFGYRWLEFLAAGGVALAHLELGEADEAERWLDRARSSAMIQPTPLRARQLELWRGLARATAGDAEGAVARLERARALAWEQRNKPGVAESTAELALHSARLAADNGDEALLAKAEAWAAEALDQARAQPGQHPWTARALAATAQLALARGRDAEAAGLAADAIAAMDLRLVEPVLLDVEQIVVRCMASNADPRSYYLKARIREDLDAIASRILEPAVRERWLAAPVQREIASIVGDIRVEEEGAGARTVPDLSEPESSVLRLLARGRTNREIAAELGLSEPAVATQVKAVMKKLGVKTRAQATTAALQAGVG